MRSAEQVAAALHLAAAAVAAGFLSFLPTAYQGVSELGLIAGVGMVVAFLTSITVLPAMLTLLNPPGEKEPVGYKALAPVDDFSIGVRIPCWSGPAWWFWPACRCCFHLDFDFNPIEPAQPEGRIDRNLSRPAQGPRDRLTADRGADRVRRLRRTRWPDRMAKVPEVARTMTLDRFVPEDQDTKLPLFRPAPPAPSDRTSTVRRTRRRPTPRISRRLRNARGPADRCRKGKTGSGRRRRPIGLPALSPKLADADPATREQVRRPRSLRRSACPLDGLRKPAEGRTRHGEEPAG